MFMKVKSSRRRLTNFGAMAALGASMVLLASAVTPVNAAESADERGAESQPTTRAEVDAIMAPTVNDPLADATAALEAVGIGGVGDKFPSLFAGFEVVEDGKRLNVLYNSTGDAKTVETFLALVDQVTSVAALDVVAVPVDFDPVQRSALAQKISADSDGWAERLGLKSLSNVSFNTVSGEVLIVTADDVSPDVRSVVEIEGVPVSIIRDGTATAGPQNRTVDSAPWTGGSRLSLSSSDTSLFCTAGFNWRKWGTTEEMGSTAEHCFTGSQQSYWYNSGVLLGQRYYYNVAYDTMLLRSSPQGQFQAKVWVGSTVTSDRRSVHNAQSSEPVNGAIALSGGKTGLTVGTILPILSYYQGTGPYRRTTVTACQLGDSGGPWLTTRNDGKAIAHGQHWGVFNDSLGYNCSYMSVTRISAALSASIMSE